MIGPTNAEKTQATKSKKRLFPQASLPENYDRQDSKTELTLPSIVFSQKAEFSAQRSPVNVLASTLASSNTFYNQSPNFNSLPSHSLFTERLMAMFNQFEADPPSPDMHRLHTVTLESPKPYYNTPSDKKKHKFRSNNSLSINKSSQFKGTSPKQQFFIKSQNDDFSKALYGIGSPESKPGSKVVSKMKEITGKKETDDDSTQIRDYNKAPTTPMAATVRKNLKSQTVVTKMGKFNSPTQKSQDATETQPENQPRKKNPVMSARILVKAPTEDGVSSYVSKESKVIKLRNAVSQHANSEDEELKVEEPPEKNLVVAHNNPTSLSTAEKTSTNPDTPSNRGFENSGTNTPKDKHALNSSRDSQLKSKPQTNRKKSNLAISTAPAQDQPTNNTAAHISFHGSEKDSQMTRPSNQDEITRAPHQEDAVTKSRFNGATYIRILTDKSEEPALSPGVSTGKETNKAAPDTSISDGNLSSHKLPTPKFPLNRKVTADEVLEENHARSKERLSDSSEESPTKSPKNKLRRHYTGVVGSAADKFFEKRATIFQKNKLRVSRSFESLDTNMPSTDLCENSQKALNKINFAGKKTNSNFILNSSNNRDVPVMDIADHREELLQKMEDLCNGYLRDKAINLEDNFLAKEVERMKTVDFSTLLKVDDEASSKYNSGLVGDSKTLDVPLIARSDLNHSRKITVNIIPPPIMEESVQYETDSPAQDRFTKRFEFTLERGNSWNEVEGDFKRLRSIEELDELIVNSRVLFGDNTPIDRAFSWNDDSYFSKANGQRDFLNYFEELVKMNKRIETTLIHHEEKYARLERHAVGESKIDRRELDLYIDANPVYVDRGLEGNYEDPMTLMDIERFMGETSKDYGRGQFDISTASLSSRKYIDDEARLEFEFQKVGNFINQPVLSSHMPYISNTHHAIISLKDARYQMTIFMSNKASLYEYLTIHSLNLQKIKLVDPMIKISKIINSARPETMDFIKNLIIQGYYFILEGNFQSQVKIKKINLDDPHIQEPMSASVKSTQKVNKTKIRGKRTKNLENITPKHTAFEETNHLNLPKSALAPTFSATQPTSTLETRSSLNGMVLESQGSYHKPNVSIVITTPGGAPKSPELLPIESNLENQIIHSQSYIPSQIMPSHPYIPSSQFIPSRKNSGFMTAKENDKDSSFKSRNENKSIKSNMEESTKPPTAELDLTSMVRRKAPSLADKIKAGRRGAETLDIKDIKEIHNTFTRRNLLDATKVHDTKIHESRIEPSKIPAETKIHDITAAIGQPGMSPIQIKRGRETTKTSPGGNFAKIVLDTIKKPEYPEGNEIPVEHNNKMTLSMKSELRNLNKMDKNALLMRIHSQSFFRKQGKHPLEQMFQCVFENRIEPLLELLRTYQIISVDLPDEHGNYMLGIASQCGFYDIVKTLLERGANPNIQNYEGNAPLHLSMAFGHSDISDALIQHGAHQNVVNASGRTPWELAQS